MIHSASTSTLQYFDPAKWKTKLHKISDKLHLGGHSWNVKGSKSATTLAAATEKYIRTKSTEIAIHSEDLTASQFADLTGIKTKRNSLQSIYSDDSDSDDDSECDYYTTMASSLTSGNNRHSSSMQIWDSHFWQNGRKSLPAAITTVPLNKSNSMNQVALTTANNKLLTSQPLVRNRSEPSRSTCVQKGRFKIVFGQDDSNVEVKTPAPCVEWKRKRASSNPTATEL